MESEQIQVVKEWLELKTVQNIQVFLGFANFYCQFIKNFRKIAAPLMSMLETTMLSQVFATNKVLDTGVLAADETGDVRGGDGLKHVEPERSKSQKLATSQKSKKLSKNGNLPNFNDTEAGPSFLTLEARTTFNCLQLAFTKAPILYHFDLECQIWIETNALGYAIGNGLCQLTSGTRPDGVVIKINLGQCYFVALFFRKMIPAEI